MCLVLVICTLTIWNSMLCVLMVEGMSVVVNVMLSLMGVMSPSHNLCNLSLGTVVKLCALGVFALGVSLVSWSVMTSACVLWISILSSSSLFLIQFMLTWSIMRFLSLLPLGLYTCVVCEVMWLSLVCLWGCLGTLCECGGCSNCDACTVVCVPCVYAERVWGCEGDGNAGVGDGGGVIVVSAGHKYVGGTSGSGFVSSAAEVLGMSVVRGMREVGGLCEMCMCLARAV